MGTSNIHPNHTGHVHVSHLSPVGSGPIVSSAGGLTSGASELFASTTNKNVGAEVSTSNRSPSSTAGPMIAAAAAAAAAVAAAAGAQHLGQPLYQEFTHTVRPRVHAVPPPVYVTATPTQSSQQQQIPTFHGFTPGWVPRQLVDACTCVLFQ